MVKYIYNEDGEVIGEYSEESKSSRFRNVLGGLGNEIKGFHQMMLRKKAEASKRNEMINKMNRKGRKRVMPDHNILHTHNHTRIGW